MRFLHHSRLIHRDLKSGNVLIQSDGRAKICDFGLSSFRDASVSAMTGIVGTAAWSAPESLRNEQVNASSDVYSFGVILWELGTLQVPWEGLTMIQIITQVAALNKKLVLPAVSADFPEPHQQLIRRCFAAPVERPSFDTLFAELNILLLNEMKKESEELQRLPDSFLCPISFQVMTDPVICADGYSYERDAIASWLGKSNCSPMTNEELSNRSLTPNHALRSAIERYTSDAR
jgi:serine/threonine protein kinase